MRASVIFISIALLLPWTGLWLALFTSWQRGLYYEYGFLVPPLAAILVYSRATERTPPSQDRGSLFSLKDLPPAFAAAAVLISVGLAEGADPLWRLPLWLHALSCLAVTGWIAVVLGGLKFARSLTGTGIFLLSGVPLPSFLEAAFVQGMTDSIAGLVSFGLNLAGIPAYGYHGLIIGEAATVSVANTCSGLRSLQASLMAGLFFGEWFRLNLVRRAGLLVLALAVTTLANIARVAWLAWLSIGLGEPATDEAHDLGGAIAFAVSAGLLLLVAYRFMRPRPEVALTTGVRPAVAAPILILGFTLGLLPVLAREVWFSPRATGSPTGIGLQLPDSLPGFTFIDTDQIRSSALLGADRIEAGRRQLGNGEYLDVTTVHYSSANPSGWFDMRLHGPEICMPHLGLEPAGAKQLLHIPLRGGDLEVDEHLFRAVSGGESVYVFRAIKPHDASEQGKFESMRWKAFVGRRPNWGMDVLLAAVVLNHPDPVRARELFADLLTRSAASTRDDE